MGIIALFINETYPSCVTFKQRKSNRGTEQGVEATRAQVHRGSRRALPCCFRGKNTVAWANVVKCLRYLEDSRALAKEDQGRRGPGMTKAESWNTERILGVADMNGGV